MQFVMNFVTRHVYFNVKFITKHVCFNRINFTKGSHAPSFGRLIFIHIFTHIQDIFFKIYLNFINSI